MARWLFLGAAWTGVVVTVLLLWPRSVPSGGCWGLVEPPAGCLAELAQLNERVWWTQTLPILLFFAVGYVVVGLLAIRHRRRSRP